MFYSPLFYNNFGDSRYKNMKYLKIIIATAALLIGELAFAQRDPALYIKQDIDRCAGFYHHYEIPVADRSIKTRPEGFEPFYISHYGRHGCRWHHSEMKYKGTLGFFQMGADQNLLTKKGKRFLEDMKVVAADAEGQYGDLTPRGARTHKGIAARMYKNYPEVFQPGAKIDTKSTTVVRCVLSMAAFDESLKEQEPELEITRTSSERNMVFMSHPNGHSFEKEINRITHELKDVYIPSERWMKSMFKDGGKFLEGKINDPESLMYDCFEMAAMMQNCDYLNKDLYYIFNKEEILGLWKYMNAYGYMYMGPAPKFADERFKAAGYLLKDIVDRADDVIEGRSDVSANLRFGHDSNILPLLGLLQIEGASERVPVEECWQHWNLSDVSPMAANIQFIFFKNKAGEIKVRVLRNEQDAKMPVKGFPFYDWKDLREYLTGLYDIK